ncbi:MAG: TldD/PmbA family protein [Acidimicrobiales bacterium]|jgi:PmbA protein
MPDLLGLARRVLAKAGADEQVEVYVAHGRETSIRVFEGEIEELTAAESAGVGVRVISDGRQGFSYVGALDESAAAEALVEARDNARFATVDEHAGLASPDGVEAPVLELWRDELVAFPTDEKVALALELERRVRGGDPRIRQVVSSDYVDGFGETAIATSRGIEVTSRQTGCYLFVHAVAGDGDDTQTGLGYSVGRAPDDLDLEAAGTDAVERATRLLGAKKAKSAKLTAVLDRRVTATLLGILASTLSGEEAIKGRSLFAGRIGEKVGVDELTLVDDPTNPLAYGASEYDAEGLACRRNALISGGELTGFLYDTYAANLAGTSSTGSAVRGGFRTTPGVGAQALALEPGNYDQSEIIAKLGDGFLVQSITGVHSGVNRVSGDFSVGAEGLMIRGGELAEPVREVTIASTIQRMLQHVVAVGSDVEWLPGAAMGVTLAVADIAMSGS